MYPTRRPANADAERLVDLDGPLLDDRGCRLIIVKVVFWMKDPTMQPFASDMSKPTRLTRSGQPG
jgi:hypothetical protein